MSDSSWQMEKGQNQPGTTQTPNAALFVGDASGCL
jgi:hypothetical protein